MNKEITIYELLGLIKDDKVPKKIEYEGKIYIFSGDDYSVNDDLEEWLLSGYYLTTLLNEKVKILEEDKDIELLNLDTDKLKGKEVIRAIDYLLEGRINELVKEVNKLRKDNNNG